MSSLKIALLGPPEVEHGDHRLTFPDRKVLALLAYLATEGGMQERQKLTRLLWPESDMAHGRTTLRLALLHLRRILEEDASPEGEAHLLITHDTIGLDLASGIDLDLHALEAAWLFSETNGHPFYLRALLQELLERGLLVPRLIAGSGWVFEPQPSILEATLPDTMLPWDVREMIQQRLARLSSPARDLLAAGAVLGHDFTFEDLCQVARLAPQDGLVALDEALQSLLLRESGHWREGRRGVSYHFADDKIREVVYAAAGDARRRVFRSRAYFAGARGRHRRSAGLPPLARGSPDLTFRWGTTPGSVSK